MQRSRWSRLVALCAVGALALSACGSDDDDKDSSKTSAASGGESSGTTAARPSGEGGGTCEGGEGTETIKLVRNAWTASAVEAEMMKQIIERCLGNPVEIVDINENDMFVGLSDGDVDAVMELWPSGVAPEEQAFIDDGSVVEMGELGAIGKIGWFVPDYVLDEYPQLESWEGLKDPEVAEAFATAETGDKGRFLGTDPSYSQYDESIVENLDLPFEVIYSGSEAATVAEVDTRVAAGEPVLLYWWTPTAAVAKYNLKNLALPEYSEECYAVAEDVDCDYPEDVLVKLASAKLEEKDPTVFEFLQNVQITTDQQLELLPAVEIDGEPVEDVVSEWLDANESVWQAWLP